MNRSAAKNILITGGAGFVGLHLARFLLGVESKAMITLVDNFSRGKKDDELGDVLKNHRIKFIQADLTNAAVLEKLGGTFDYVYHLAAINGTKFFYEIPHEVLRVNTLSLLNVLEWFCKGPHGKLVFSSSSETYAGSVNLGIAKVPTPEDVPLSVVDLKNPRWSYGGSKIIGELFCLNYGRIYKKPISIVRFHNFYGPRMGFEHVIPEFCKRIVDGEDPFIIKGGDQTRSFCYILDGVRGLHLAMAAQKADNEIINLGNDKEEIKIEALAKLLFEISGRKPKIKIEAEPKGSIARRCPDLKKARSLLGYEPQVLLREGLEKTWQWYREFFTN